MERDSTRLPPQRTDSGQSVPRFMPAASAFAILRFVGAGYLLFLGVRAIASSFRSTTTGPARSPRKLFSGRHLRLCLILYAFKDPSNRAEPAAMRNRGVSLPLVCDSPYGVISILANEKRTVLCNSEPYRTTPYVSLWCNKAR
jgi:hypothetical protein